jgi:hypothetical protein
MLYLLLADFLVFLHVAFVAFVVLGVLLVQRSPRLAWIHLPSALWGALIEFAGWGCPLTPLENRFRQLGGGAGYGRFRGTLFASDPVSAQLHTTDAGSVRNPDSYPQRNGVLHPMASSLKRSSLTSPSWVPTAHLLRR